METIVFDIETGALPEGELEAMLPEFDPAEVKTGNIKDPEKIASKIAEAEVNHRREFFDRAALDPLTGRVIAIGLLRNAEGRLQSAEFKVLSDEDEAVLLREFWGACLGDMGRINELIGFNVCGFDLPFLVRRSWKHGVRVPTGIRRGRYWSEQVLDVREVWQLGDRMARGSLDAVAKHLGVGQKTGDGKEFAQLWATDRNKAIAYLHNDVLLTAKVAEALGALRAPGA